MTPTPPLALPALPEPRYFLSSRYGFTADQMTAYATAAILSDRAGRGDAAGWVSVKDRLPEVGASVWVALWAWNDPKRGQRVYGHAYYGDDQWINPQDDDGPCVWYPPTHWMPLPAHGITGPATKETAK